MSFWESLRTFVMGSDGGSTEIPDPGKVSKHPMVENSKLSFASGVAPLTGNFQFSPGITTRPSSNKARKIMKANRTLANRRAPLAVLKPNTQEPQVNRIRKNASGDSPEERSAKRAKIAADPPPPLSKSFGCSSVPAVPTANTNACPVGTSFKKRRMVAPEPAPEPAKLYTPSIIAMGPPPSFSNLTSKNQNSVPLSSFTTWFNGNTTHSSLQANIKKRQLSRKESFCKPMSSANVNKRMQARSHSKLSTAMKSQKAARFNKISEFRRAAVDTVSALSARQPEHSSVATPPSSISSSVKLTTSAKKRRTASPVAEKTIQPEKVTPAAVEPQHVPSREIPSSRPQSAKKTPFRTPKHPHRKKATPSRSNRRTKTPRSCNAKPPAGTPANNKTKTPRSCSAKKNHTPAVTTRTPRSCTTRAEAAKKAKEEEQQAQIEKQQQEREERQAKRAIEKLNAEKELAERVRNRQAELRNQDYAKKNEVERRQKLQQELDPIVKARFGSKSYVHLCKEFLPRARLSANPDRDEIRRTLRRAMARYHPDKARHLDTFREQVESELIFEGLKEAYQEIVQYCKLRNSKC
mmetsp:Transcript_41111/g.80635  ORF Transcript_41111/g.80635 Transcript_41111/m.80635 type:complete len:579 (+) Transcript_41111:41-1777(+)